MKPPSRRQGDALKVIAAHLRWRGYPPTQREIGRVLGINVSSTWRLIAGLRDKGYLRDEPKGIPRALALTPEAHAWLEQHLTASPAGG